MAELAGSAVATGTARRHFTARARRALGDPRRLVLQAIEIESAEWRFFLWLPVAAGSGAVFYLLADQEPSLAYAGAAAAFFAALAFLLRGRRLARGIALGLCCLALGLVSASWRAARVAAPVIDRIRIVRLEGFVEEMDFRRTGARFLLRPTKADGLAALPFRVRLTLTRTPPFEAGAYVRLKARLLPPAQASLPGGYDFARDAWFAQIGAVGNVLGRAAVIAPPAPPDPVSAFMMAVDRGRNALERRVYTTIGGEPGAIAAAMVTGKRDLLSDDTKEIIREAGIFHIITISGVQMTLVTGIFFIGLRALLALSPTLALRHPIKKWAAAAAIFGALLYDILTGSRVGTERALIMTTIMLAAVLIDRQSLSMRNLAIAAGIIILLEPEALLSASFQLSFAAVAALVAVYEARSVFAVERRTGGGPIPVASPLRERFALIRERFAHGFAHGPAALIFATFCATTATASFMAYNFHELSPYVLIGNPLTLLIIEIFAVPGALLGTVLYPLGLDGFVWHYVGVGISFVLFAARLIGGMPGATLHVNAFSPWAIVFLTFAVLSAVIWRSTLLRMTAIPLAAIGLYGAATGPSFDVAVAADGRALAVRGADGTLSVIGRHPSLFSAEQWLRADADWRDPRAALDASACDRLGCVGILPDGRAVALVLDSRAFAEDCLRADIIVTPLYAPTGCAAPLVIDRERLRRTGALTLAARGTRRVMTTARAPEEDRPWSAAPRPRWGNAGAKGEASDDPSAPLE